MSRLITRVACTVALLAAPAAIRAQAGASGFALLKLGSSAQGTAMGEAVTALVSGAPSTSYNPAGLAPRGDSLASQIQFTHREWVADTRIEYLMAAVNLDGSSSLGFSLHSAATSDIEIRTRPGPPEGTFTARSFHVGASYTLPGSGPRRGCELRRGPGLRAHDQTGKSAELLRKAASLDADNPAYRIVLETHYVQRNALAEGVAVFEQLAKEQPENPLNYLFLGRLHDRLNQLEAAERAYRRVQELAPQLSDGYRALAELYLRTNRKPAEARALAQKAVELEPSGPHYYLLAVACVKNNDRAGALEAIKRATALNPGEKRYEELLQQLQGARQSACSIPQILSLACAPATCHGDVAMPIRSFGVRWLSHTKRSVKPMSKAPPNPEWFERPKWPGGKPPVRGTGKVWPFGMNCSTKAH